MNLINRSVYKADEIIFYAFPVLLPPSFARENWEAFYYFVLGKGNNSELYYRFEVKEWKKTPQTIAAKEMHFTKHLTNYFLLSHSKEMPELWIQSEEEYRLYTELKRAVHDMAIQDDGHNLGFTFGEFSIHFASGKISISKGTAIFAQYDIADFSRSPNAVFRQIQHELLRMAGK